MSKNLLPTWAPIILVAIAACPGCDSGEAGANDDDHNDVDAPVRVEVLSPVPTTLKRTTTQPATVHAYFEANIYAKATGYLTELKADIGQEVKNGEVLGIIGVPELEKKREAKLAAIRRLKAEQQKANSDLNAAKASMASYQAKLDRAKAGVLRSDAQLAAARAELDRVTDLVNEKAVADRLLDEAQKKYDSATADKAATNADVTSAESEVELADAKVITAQAELDVAKAKIEVAERELDELDELLKYSRLKSPFDGVVTERNVDPGDLVRDAPMAAGAQKSPLFVVSKLDKVRVRVPVPERDAPFANVGDSATITLQALPGEEIEGELSRVAGVLDEKTRTMLVEIDLENSDDHLRPGMFGQATITLDSPKKTVMLPVDAVRFDENGNSYVYNVNDDSTIEVVDVQTGLDDGEQIEIISGLRAKDRVVGPLLRRLKPGDSVEVESEELRVE